jgi:ArsR family transcriptional regulator
MNGDICEQHGSPDLHNAEKLKSSIADIAGLSELFKALADETRTSILYLISQAELCVCDLAYLLGMTLPAISHHLRLLKALRLVKSRKEGKMVFYSLEDEHVFAIIEDARKHYIEKR